MNETILTAILQLNKEDNHYQSNLAFGIEKSLENYQLFIFLYAK